METVLRVFRQTFWQLLGKFITALSTILILALISRQFGETGTGIFTLALTYLAFFTIAVDFSLNAYLIPSLLKDGLLADWRKLFGLRLILAAPLIIIALAIALIGPFPPIFKQIIIFGSLMAILEPAIFITCNAIFQIRLRYDLSVIAWSTGALVTLGLIFLQVRLGGLLSNLIWAYIAGWIVTSIFALIFVKKFIKDIKPIFDFKFIRNVLTGAWPISTTLVLNVLYFRLDAFILSQVYSFKEVGIYNLAYQFFQSGLVLPTFIMNSYFPLMVQNLSNNVLLSSNKERFKSNLIKTCLIMLLISVLGLGLTYFYGGFFIELVTGGKGFIGSFKSLQILSLSFPAYFVSAVLMWAMVALKKYKTILLIYLIGLLTNFIFNLYLIPRFSYLGAAAVTGISEYLILALQITILYQYFKSK
ncbi:oligosaccharide flippase family protein [Candidatus Daviesbacteria bacterium]|nr:oligosaccharide flippase family protein [Candidatus Daviesbacteria bacterium]